MDRTHSMDRTHDNVVTVRSASEIVGTLPYTMGFHPQRSLVVISCEGPRRRVEFTMRVDLPEVSDEHTFADQIAAQVDHARAEAVVVVCFSEEADDDAGLPRRELVERLLDHCDHLGVVVLDALLVRGGRWWSYLCDAECGPPDGTPLPDELSGAASQLAAEVVAAGTSVLPDRDSLVASVAPAVDPMTPDPMARALDRAAARLEASLGADPGDAAAETVRLVQDALASEGRGRRGLGDDEAARIILGLHDKRARDEVMTIPLDADPAACLALLIGLARRAPDPEAAPVCTVVAAAAYLAGDGALANVALDRALSCHPGYEMAALLRSMLDAQFRPTRLREVLRQVQTELARPGRRSLRA